jgi:hypothetical protein
MDLFPMLSGREVVRVLAEDAVRQLRKGQPSHARGKMQ